MTKPPAAPLDKLVADAEAELEHGAALLPDQAKRYIAAKAFVQTRRAPGDTEGEAA